jgi:hypothetical protein
MMRKSLKRVFDRLRSLTKGRPQKETSMRGGLQTPQRIGLRPAPARVRS